jgi:hypothetical protein
MVLKLGAGQRTSKVVFEKREKNGTFEGKQKNEF